MTCKGCNTYFCYDCGVRSPHPPGSTCVNAADREHGAYWEEGEEGEDGQQGQQGQQGGEGQEAYRRELINIFRANYIHYEYRARKCLSKCGKKCLIIACEYILMNIADHFFCSVHIYSCFKY